MFRYILVVLVLVIPIGITHAEEGEFNLDEYRANLIKTADALWPSTQNWRSIKDVPSPNLRKMKYLRGKLSDAYVKFSREHKHAKFWCSEIGLLSKDGHEPSKGDYSSFHLFDINKDGITDVVYAGSSSCIIPGGDLTIVWLGNKGEFEVQQEFKKKKMLRVSPTGIEFTSVRVSESDEQGDNFMLGNKEVFVYHDTQLPSKSLNAPKPFVNQSETVLRWSPIENNERNDGYSEFLEEEVIGNQMKRYRAGASGKILSEQRDAQGKLWNFVLMDDSSRKLEVRSIFGDVSQPGWIRAIKSSQNAVPPTQQVAETEGGRLVNEFTGSNQCLRSTSKTQVRLLGCSSDRALNQWTAIPLLNSDFVNLKGQPSNSNQCLALEKSGTIMMKRCDPGSPGQMWGFTQWKNGDDEHARLQNALSGEQRCLDVINDGTNNQVHMSECGNYSGQAWSK